MLGRRNVGLTQQVLAFVQARPLRAICYASATLAVVYTLLIVSEWESIPKSIALLSRAYFWTDAVAFKAASARRWNGVEKRIQLALILPMTSRGNEGPIKDRKKESVLVLAVFLKSLSTAVLRGKEGRIDYTVYLGMADDDTALDEATSAWIMDTAGSWLFSGLPIVLKTVRYPGGQTLTQMYNHLSVAAHADAVDYVFNVNDDLTVAFPFAETMIHTLETSAVAPGFGTSGLAEKWQGLDLKTRCPMYNMVSAAHLRAFAGYLYDDFFPNYGIDTAICHLYGSFDASFYVLEPHLVNHVNIDGSSAVPTRYIPGKYKDKSQYVARTALHRPPLVALLAHFKKHGSYEGFACIRESTGIFVCP